MEPIPIVGAEGGVVGYTATGGVDVTLVWGSRAGRAILWTSTRSGVDVTPLLGGESGLVLRGPGDFTIDLGQWEEMMPELPFTTFTSVEELLSELASRLRGVLEGRRVLVSFSGGKDSFAALYLLARLREWISFDLRAAYTHMPVLEPRGYVDAAIDAASKLGVEVEVLRPDPRQLRDMLWRNGLPRRGSRWCTFLKRRPLDRLVRELKPDYVVVADRLAENPKRAHRLMAYASRGELARGKQLRLTWPLTLLDVARLCRLAGYVHPAYKLGRSRVSCLYCPYRPLPELEREETGYEWLVEKLARRSWRLHYSRRGITWEEFTERHLWRYRAPQARVWNEVMRYAEELAEKGELRRVEANLLLEWQASMWLNPLPKAVAPRSTVIERVAEWLNPRGRRFHSETLEG